MLILILLIPAATPPTLPHPLYPPRTADLAPTIALLPEGTTPKVLLIMKRMATTMK
jgi:hypothetical protein